MKISQFLKETGMYKPQRDQEIRAKISRGVKRNWIKRKMLMNKYINNEIIEEDKPTKAGEQNEV